MTASPHAHHALRNSRLGGWLPHEHGALSRWLKNTREHAAAGKARWHPLIAEFQTMIEADPVLYMYFTLMFEQQPGFTPPPDSGDIKLRDYHEMLLVMNHLLGTAPAYEATDMVGCPINAILDFPMFTPAGLAAFLHPKVNGMIRKLLTAWAGFLDSEASRYVLNDSDSGWFGAPARKALQLDDYQTDPSAPYLGFLSWNDFFIRQFRPHVRPVAHPEDDKVIIGACEATPYAIGTQVRELDTFWIKSQPYSLRQMLNGQFVDRFVGGTVYQAYLSAQNYHRWHSPVAGSVLAVHHVPGSYYAEAASEGFDRAGPNHSQAYLAHVATRSLIFIEAADPAIGLVCVMPIGMAEVSSCVVTVSDGQRVSKGEQLGYFQYGGSTHCLLFGPGVIRDFALQAIPQGPAGASSALVRVNSLLALAG
jgi:phosphatidylserine decarboxylase